MPTLNKVFEDLKNEVLATSGMLENEKIYQDFHSYFGLLAAYGKTLHAHYTDYDEMNAKEDARRKQLNLPTYDGKGFKRTTGILIHPCICDSDDALLKPVDNKDHGFFAESYGNQDEWSNKLSGNTFVSDGVKCDCIACKLRRWYKDRWTALAFKTATELNDFMKNYLEEKGPTTKEIKIERGSDVKVFESFK